jgi:hypothetical protein
LRDYGSHVGLDAYRSKNVLHFSLWPALKSMTRGIHVVPRQPREQPESSIFMRDYLLTDLLAENASQSVNFDKLIDIHFLEKPASYEGTPERTEAHDLVFARVKPCVFGFQ